MCKVRNKRLAKKIFCNRTCAVFEIHQLYVSSYTKFIDRLKEIVVPLASVSLIHSS